MKIFKLANSELKKIFLKPIMIIAFFAIIATLLVANFSFSPAQKSKTTVNLGGVNLVSSYNLFIGETNPNSKSKLDEILDKQKDTISNFWLKIEGENELNQFKAFITATDTSIQQLQMIVVDYYKNPKEATVEQVQAKFNAISTASSNTLNFLNELSESPNISFYISIEQFDTLTAFFKGISQNVPQTFANPDLQFKEVSNFLSENYSFTNIAELIKNLKVLPITSEKTDEILQKYYYEIYASNIDEQDTKLGKLALEIKNFVQEKPNSTLPEDFDKLNKMVSNYKSIINMSTTALKNAWTIETAGEKSDVELHNYIGFSKYNSYFYKQNLTLNKYLLENNKYDYEYLTPFSFNSNSGERTNAFDFTVYAMQILSFVLSLFLIFVTSGTIASELSNGTMKMLAIRPYSRTKIILAKFLACFNFMLLLLAMGSIISFIVGYVSYGVPVSNVLVVFNTSKIFTLNGYIVLLLYLASCVLNLSFFIAFTLLVSVLFKSNVISVIFGLLFYGLSIIFNALLYAKNWFNYIPFAHLDLYKYLGAPANTGQFFGFSVASGSSFAFSCFYILFSILICTSVTCFIFRKRNIA